MDKPVSLSSLCKGVTQFVGAMDLIDLGHAAEYSFKIPKALLFSLYFLDSLCY